MSDPELPPTGIAAILARVRAQLREPTARFWTDAELMGYMTDGAKDLWRAILDLHAEHYLKECQVVLRSGDTKLSGVPDDCFRVWNIEPWDTTPSGSSRGVLFTPRKYNSQDMISARATPPLDPSNGATRVIYYDVSGVGAPVTAPLIRTAPGVRSDVLVRLAYNPTVQLIDRNPIPGEADHALLAYTLAYARAKESDSQGADPMWLSVYESEKTKILTGLTPRQEQEQEVVEDFFQGVGSMW